jgi:hypothetical protein
MPLSRLLNENVQNCQCVQELTKVEADQFHNFSWQDLLFRLCQHPQLPADGVGCAMLSREDK